MSVVIYTTPTCGFCRQVKAYLSQKGVPFVERDVSRDPQAASEMVRISGQQGVPVTVIDGQMVLGANMPLLDQLLARRAASPPRLGVAVADAARIAEKKGLRLPQGAYIGRVHPGSAGALAGLRTGDVIVQLAGQPVRGERDVHQIVSGIRPDQVTEVIVWRDGQRIGKTLRF